MRSGSEAIRNKASYAYIERCFLWAHEADPQALLFITMPKPN
jgi:GH35 family endo-1,4-beta-xylanase